MRGGWVEMGAEWREWREVHGDEKRIKDGDGKERGDRKTKRR